MSKSSSLKLGDVISITKGKKHIVTYSPNSLSKRLIGIEDLRSDNIIRYSNDKKGTTADASDVLIAWDGANAGTIGYGKVGYIGSTIARLQIKDKSLVDTEFLGLYLRSKFNYLRQTATGATIPHINRAALEKISLPAIDLDDQVRIAYLLKKVDSLIALRKQHLQQLDELLKSIFLDMFGPTTQEFETWPLVEIKDLAESHKGSMRTGPFGSNLLHSEFTEDGDVAVLGIDNAVKNRFTWGERRYITTKKYEELKNYTIYPGDVIVTIMGTIGRSAVIPNDIPLAINTKHLAAITLNRKVANPVFISYSIHSSPFILDQFKSKNRGAIMSGLNLTLIKETKLRRPPIRLQNFFEKIHNQVDRVRCEYQISLSNLESLYGALSQKAFKGELDLSNIPLGDSSDKSRTVSDDSALDKLEKQLESITKPIKHLEKISRITQTPGIPGLEAINRITAPLERVASITAPIDRVMQHLNTISDLSTSFKPLKSEKARQQWIDGTLNDHLSDLDSQDEFSVDQLMQAFQQVLENIESDDELDSSLLTSSYDQVKNWIFDKIRGGLLIQDFDSDNNQLTLRKA